jgi:hypothetical protein
MISKKNLIVTVYLDCCDGRSCCLEIRTGRCVFRILRKEDFEDEKGSDKLQYVNQSELFPDERK